MKISLYNLSLMFLYISIIVLTIDMNIEIDCNFIKSQKILSIGVILPCICFILILWGVGTICVLKGWLKSTPDMPKKVIKVSKTNESYLEFLAAYIIPLVCFDFSNPRQILVFFIFYILIGCIYIRTNLFCTNPTLALLGYDIYNVEYQLDNGKTQEILAFANEKILSMEGKRVRFININKSIYMLYNPKIRETK